MTTLTSILVEHTVLCKKINKGRKKLHYKRSFKLLYKPVIHLFIHSFIYVIVTYLEFTMSKKILWELVGPCPTELEGNWKEMKFQNVKHIYT